MKFSRSLHHSNWKIFAGALLLALLFPGRGWSAAASRHQEEKAQDGFFIVSSINPSKHEIVFKLPTEVTELMEINAKTQCQDEQGKAIDCMVLRAGDTVYVTSKPDSAARSVAVRIRKGPMTLEELHRRYLNY